jgi:hypothetical protein
LGRHSKPSRIRLPQGATAAAAPALAIGAAAFCLAPHASAATLPTSASSAAASATATPGGLAIQGEPATGVSVAALVHSMASETDYRLNASATSSAAQSSHYKVISGDSLSSIAGHVYHDRADWTAIYWRNRAKVHWADDIYAGEVLRIPAKPKHHLKAPSQLEPATVAPAQQAATAAPTTAASGTGASYTGGVPGGSFGECVIERESGGNAQIMNASGHYGLYQFSAATWAAYGGNPAAFGDASVAEQNQVFANAIAAGGEDNWAPYDGC